MALVPFLKDSLVSLSSRFDGRRLELAIFDELVGFLSHDYMSVFVSG